MQSSYHSCFAAVEMLDYLTKSFVIYVRIATLVFAYPSIFFFILLKNAYLVTNIHVCTFPMYLVINQQYIQSKDAGRAHLCNLTVFP